MKDRLIEQILEHYNKYKNEIIKQIEEYSYRKRRYNVDFTLALFLAEKELQISLMASSIRDTDKLIVLEKNLACVAFDFSDEENGLKATENLLTRIEPKHFEHRLFVSVENSHDYSDEDEQVRRLLDTLIEEIQNGFDRLPMS